MTDQKKDFVKGWLEIAEEDFETVRKLSAIEEDLIFFRRTICINCQQCTEKIMKAFLILRGQEIRKTHNLEMLAELCKKIDVNLFNDFDFRKLNSYSINIRYPADMEIPNIEETKIFINDTRKFKDLLVPHILSELEK